MNKRLLAALGPWASTMRKWDLTITPNERELLDAYEAWCAERGPWDGAIMSTEPKTFPAPVVFAVLDGAIDVCDRAIEHGGNPEIVNFRKDELVKIRAACEWYLEQYQ